MDYIIKKDKNKSTWIPKLRLSNEICGVIEFLNDAEYNINKQMSTNRLVGLSDNLDYKKDSVNLGWRWNRIIKRLEILTIIYSNGQLSIKHLCFADAKKTYYYKIEITKSSYNIIFHKSTTTVLRTSNWKLVRYLLTPKFTRFCTAPKEFKIKINVA